MLRTILMSIFLLLPAPTTYANWQQENYHNNGFTLPYQLFTPQAKGKLPLIIHLHGSGEAGKDNIAQMYLGTQFGPQYFAAKPHQQLQPSFILAPQTPAPMRWASTTLEPYSLQSTPSTPSMTALLHLIDNMLATNSNIDPNRVYIAGLSRGGQGVWNAILQRSDLFSAAVAIAGSGDTSEAHRIAHMPIWVFAGESDVITDVNYSRSMVDALYRTGGSSAHIRYTEILGGDHSSSWRTAYANSDLYKWLIQHQKQ